MKLLMRLGQLLLVVAGIACVIGATAEAATRGPCIGTSGPKCYHWKGTVAYVSDGDTFKVDIRGDGSSAPRRVRVTGINAAELDVYSHTPSQRAGDCHGVEATARLEQLINSGNGRVRLSAHKPSSRSGARLRRAVSIWSGGRWMDLGQVMVDEGHALFHPNTTEWSWNKRYARSSQLAAVHRINYWDTDYCGPGPDQDTPLRMWVNWDADGTDSRRNMNGEWVRIKNRGSTDLSIGGWGFRDSMLHSFALPQGATIKARSSIMIFAGKRPASDSNRETHFYWGQRNPVFQNVDRRRGLGDGAYLFDRQGDLRAWMTYPCRVYCGDPLKGKVTVRAHPKSPEKVTLRNVGRTTANLEGYVVDNYPYNYSFPEGVTLLPGERLVLVVKGSSTHNTRLRKYWGKSKYILNDPGDKVILRTQRDVRIACHAWGSRRC